MPPHKPVIPAHVQYYTSAQPSTQPDAYAQGQALINEGLALIFGALVADLGSTWATDMQRAYCIADHFRTVAAIRHQVARLCEQMQAEADEPADGALPF